MIGRFRGFSGVGVSVILVAGLTLGSTLTGFVRELIVGRSFGADARTDAFFAAFALVTFLFFPFSGGAVQGALMPAYQRDAEAGQFHTSKGLMGWAAALVFAAGCLLSLLTFVFAEPMVRLCYPGFSDGTTRATVASLRVLSPIILFAAMGSVAQTALHAHRRFIAPAAIPVVTNVVVVSVVLVGGMMLGLEVDLLSWGYALGYTPWLLLLLPLAATAMGNPRAASSDDQAVVLRAFGFLGSLIVFDQLSGLVQRSMLSGYEEGLISAFNYGTRLAGLPIGILAGSLAIVLFPRMVTELTGAGEGRRPEMITTGLVVVLTLMLPASIFIAIEAHNILRLVFGGESFSAEALGNTAQVLLIYAVALPAQGLILFFGRLLVAGGRNRDLLLISVSTGLVQLGLTFVLPKLFGWQGVPFATCIYAYVHALMLGAWTRRMVTFDGRAIARSLGGVVVAGIVASTALFIPWGTSGLAVLASAGAFGALYLLVLLILMKERSLVLLFTRKSE